MCGIRVICTATQGVWCRLDWTCVWWREKGGKGGRVHLCPICLTAVNWCDSMAGIQTRAATGCSEQVMSQNSSLSSFSTRLSVLPQRKHRRWEAPLHGNNYCTCYLCSNAKPRYQLSQSTATHFKERKILCENTPYIYLQGPCRMLVDGRGINSGDASADVILSCVWPLD